jgi:hypothetical protein
MSVDYLHALEIELAREQIFAFFEDLEKWFRLNPQWHVLAYEGSQTFEAGSRFQLEVEYERPEKKISYSGVVTEFDPPTLVTVKLEGEFPREMTIEVRDARLVSLLKYREPRPTPPSAHEQRELNLWLRSVANYILISHRQSPISRVWKWFLDRYWLKMSPSGRRTVFFVVVAEGLSLVFFLLLIAWLLIFKKF